jgi:hypothetical protein
VAILLSASLAVEGCQQGGDDGGFSNYVGFPYSWHNPGGINKGGLPDFDKAKYCPTTLRDKDPRSSNMFILSLYLAQWSVCEEWEKAKEQAAPAAVQTPPGTVRATLTVPGSDHPITVFVPIGEQLLAELDAPKLAPIPAPAP